MPTVLKNTGYSYRIISTISTPNIEIRYIGDFCFWKQSDRKAIKEWVTCSGVGYEFIYLYIDYEICSQRALARNATSGKQSYEMTPKMLLLFWSWFEIPVENKGVTIAMHIG